MPPKVLLPSLLCLLYLHALQAEEHHDSPKIPARWLSDSPHQEREHITVTPGRNATIPIAIGHLNRLILPFEHPEIRTIDTATTELKGQVLYVAPDQDRPITLYVTDEKSDLNALSLTLAPKAIPPRELTIQLARAEVATPVSTHPTHRSTVEDGAHQDPVQHLKTELRALAMKVVPEGYQARVPKRGEQVHCRQAGLDVRTHQILEGREDRIAIAKITNLSGQALTLDESQCADDQKLTLAIAAWPRTTLPHQMSTEVFVAFKPKSRGDTSSTHQ